MGSHKKNRLGTDLSLFFYAVQLSSLNKEHLSSTLQHSNLL